MKGNQIIKFIVLAIIVCLVGVAIGAGTTLYLSKRNQQIQDDAHVENSSKSQNASSVESLYEGAGGSQITVGASEHAADSSDSESTASTSDAIVGSSLEAGSDAEIAGSRDIAMNVKKENEWSDGKNFFYQYSGEIENGSSSKLDGWSVSIDTGAESGNTVKVSDHWNCEMTLDGSVISLANVQYNSAAIPGAKIKDIGFIISSPQQMVDFSGEYQVNVEKWIPISDSERTDANSDSSNTTQNQTNEKSIGGKENMESGQSVNVTRQVPPQPEKGSAVDLHGRLGLMGVDLVDANGEKFQLKGVSSHGLQWYPEYINKDALRTLRDDWGANIIRLAMYTGEAGYCDGGNTQQFDKTIDTGVNAAAELGMYVIIDWHILSDYDPNMHKEEAIDFFKRMSVQYADYDNVIYEICNEPNGGIGWDRVKEYADIIIPVIRANSPDAIIICGTPTWSQDVDLVAANPVNEDHNVMYALHFYAGTHKEALRDKLIKARSQGTPVFISEFSICDASGNGGIDYDSAEKWKQLIKDTGVSFCGWSLANKDETSALLPKDCDKISGWSESDLSETGKWLRALILSSN